MSQTLFFASCLMKQGAFVSRLISLLWVKEQPWSVPQGEDGRTGSSRRAVTVHLPLEHEPGVGEAQAEFE